MQLVYLKKRTEEKSTRDICLLLIIRRQAEKTNVNKASFTFTFSLN